MLEVVVISVVCAMRWDVDSTLPSIIAYIYMYTYIYAHSVILECEMRFECEQFFLSYLNYIRGQAVMRFLFAADSALTGRLRELSDSQIVYTLPRMGNNCVCTEWYGVFS